MPTMQPDGSHGHRRALPHRKRDRRLRHRSSMPLSAPQASRWIQLHALGMEKHLGADLGDVRVHADETAAVSARAIQAQAYTVGQEIVFGAGRFAPATSDGQKLLTHELVHTQQQAKGSVRPGVQRVITDLASIPEAERRAVRVSTIPVTVPDSELRSIFATSASQAGGARTSYSVSATSIYAASVPTTPANLRGGLSSVGAYLAGQTNALPLNSTITVALDLTGYGATTNSLFRFTYFAHTENNTPSNVMLIEMSGHVGLRAIIHEIGHAVDSRRLERAWRTFDQAGQTAAARRTLLRVRSRSGLRYQAPTMAAGTYTIEEMSAAIRGNAFRTAAQQDGAAVAHGGGVTGGITDYANTGWEEYFAEAFFVYVTEPDVLQQLRPHVYRYFRQNFPLPTAQPAA